MACVLWFKWVILICKTNGVFFSSRFEQNQPKHNFRSTKRNIFRSTIVSCLTSGPFDLIRERLLGDGRSQRSNSVNSQSFQAKLTLQITRDPVLDRSTGHGFTLTADTALLVRDVSTGTHILWRVLTLCVCLFWWSALCFPCSLPKMATGFIQLCRMSDLDTHAHYFLSGIHSAGHCAREGHRNNRPPAILSKCNHFGV